MNSLPKFAGTVRRRIRVGAHLEPHTGYGTWAVETIRELVRNELVPVLESFSESVVDDLKPFLGMAEGGRRLVMGPPATPVNARDWIWTMHETTRLPVKHLENLRRAGTVIVPSVWAACCLEAQGLDTAIRIVPGGCNTAIYHPPLSRQPKFCVFGCGGNGSLTGVERKNLALAVTAFQTAFPDEKDVRLQIKVLDACPVPSTDDGRIKVIRGIVSEMEMASWFGGLDFFVSPSRGEGWGLFNVQAMACGVPLIAAPFGAVGEYLSDDNGYPVEFELVRCPMTAGEGFWAEPALTSMIERMREAYENRPGQICKGRNAALLMAGRYSWRQVVEKLVDTLAESGFYAKPPPATATVNPADHIRYFYRNVLRAQKAPLSEKYPDGLSDRALSNTPRGLGDTMLLTQLPYEGAVQNKPRFIHCNPDEHRFFEALMRFNPYYHPVREMPVVYADVLQATVDMGNGHFVQRLQRAFGLEPALKPRGYLHLSSPPARDSRLIVLHFEAGAPHGSWQRRHIHPRARMLYEESRRELQEYIYGCPGTHFVQIGQKCLALDGVEHRPDLTMRELIELMARAEYFIGIMSGPLHVATALGTKCVVLVNFPAAHKIFLPTLVDFNQVESEWFYPQNVHLHQEAAGPLVPLVSADNIRRAINGEVYPFWSDNWLHLIHARQ